jgi:hypothetical protein
VTGLTPLSENDKRFLQRLVTDAPDRRPLGRSATWFAEHFGLGTMFARHIEYLPRHIEQARELLRTHGLPVHPATPDASRADSAQYPGQSEKSQSRSPWSDSVAAKMFGGPPGQLPLRVPAGAYLVLSVKQALGLRCSRLLVVENLETFRQLEDYKWLRLDEGPATLAVFRGDSRFNGADAAKVIELREEPVWAFMDFDPAGLGLAAALPRLERVVLPSEAWLRRAARGARALELFERSRAQYSSVLDAASHPHVCAAWGLQRIWRAGVAQEGMREVRPDDASFDLR